MNAITHTPKNAAAADELAIGTTPAKLTVISATDPPLLTKTMRLKDGELEKVPGGHLLSGTARIETVADLADFKRLLMSLATCDALTYGIPKGSPVDIVTKQAWERLGSPPNPIPRSKDTFDWPVGPGIMMLDYDPEPGATALDRVGVVSVLRTVLPGLADTALLWWASSSSYIVNAATGQQMSGLRGQRLYLMVRNAADIPRAGRVIAQRLWLAEHGYIKVTASGALLQRTIFDTTVWQSSRLDFAAGAECEPPLRQERGEPVLIAGAVSIVDTQKAIPHLSKTEEAYFGQLIQTAKERHQQEAKAKRAAWIEERARKIVGEDGEEAKLALAREELAQCLDSEVLSGNFMLRVKL